MVAALVVLVVVLLVLDAALLLGVNGVDVVQEEGQHQYGEEDELVVENEHGGWHERGGVGQVSGSRDGGVVMLQ